MNYLKKITIACILLILFSACKKDNDKLIEGVWNKAKLESRVPNGVWSDSTLQCHLDDVVIFGEGGVWEFYDGTNHCHSGTGIIKGTWKFKAAGTKVIFTYDGYADEYESTVEELTESKLVLSHNAGDLNSTQFKTTYTR